MTEVVWLAVAVVLVIFLVSCIVVLAVRHGALNAGTMQIIASVSAPSGAAVAAAAMIFAVAEGPSLPLSIPTLLPPRAATTAPAPAQIVDGITVPDLVGVPLDKAKQSLAKLGLNWDVYTLPDSGFTDDVVVATKPFAGSVVNRDDVVKLRSSCSGYRCSESNNNMRWGCGFLTLIAIALFCAIISHALNSSVSTVRLFVTMMAAPGAFVGVIWLIWTVMYTHEIF
jgi:hypothetical protein